MRVGVSLTYLANSRALIAQGQLWMGQQPIAQKEPDELAWALVDVCDSLSEALEIAEQQNDQPLHSEIKDLLARATVLLEAVS
jgi:uncharacterized membrane protein YfbV (UPF0208 family)